MFWIEGRALGVWCARAHAAAFSRLSRSLTHAHAHTSTHTHKHTHTNLRGGEAREQARLEVLEADGVAVELGHERRLRVLQVGALVADDEREQLVLQALLVGLLFFE